MHSSYCVTQHNLVNCIEKHNNLTHICNFLAATLVIVKFTLLPRPTKNQTREIKNCNKMVVDKYLTPCCQLFWLIECTTICKNTNAACINIYCCSLQQKSEVILIYLTANKS